ncbi:hypothetical protein ACE1BM_23410, partial [Aeromonas jandaei]
MDRSFIITSLLTFKIFITPEFRRIYSKICFFAPSPSFFGAYLAFWTQLPHPRIICSTRNRFASVNNIASWL